MNDWLDGVRDIALRAGRAVMEIYATDFAVRGKQDTTPVTDADERAEAIITAALQSLAPGIPIVAEEAVAAGRIPAIADRFWLVDALDGTREFIQRQDEFTINIALIEHGTPLLGVVFAPALRQLFAGLVGAGAFAEHGDEPRRAIQCREIPAEGATVLASRSHGNDTALDAFIAGHRVAHVRKCGSSLKLCLVASGEADVYPRFGRTMEWDIAAGHAVLQAAGGQVLDLEGRALRYGKAGFANPHFMAQGRRPLEKGTARG